MEDTLVVSRRGGSGIKLAGRSWVTGEIACFGRIVSFLHAHVGATFGKKQKRFLRRLRRVLHLSALPNSIFKPYPNIAQNLNTFGHFARYHRVFVHNSPFQPLMKASTL
jgi:hypothetical protein